MKHFIHYSAILAAAAICLTSCLKPDPILHTGTEICNVLGPTSLVTDNGVRLNVIENLGDPLTADMKRIIVDCDVMRPETEDQEVYDIRIRSYAPFEIKDAVFRSSSDDAALGDDCITVDAAWLGGGYINALTTITELKNSETVHEVNLMFDDTRSGQDTLYFKFRHNAFGESYDNPELSDSKLITSGLYFSFPFEELLPSGCKSIIIHLENDCFVTINNILTRDRTTCSGNLKYTE